MKKTFSIIMFVSLLVGMLIPAFQIQPVSASGTIYIRADGSVEGTTYIQTADKATYFFTEDIINDSIIVERNNIIIDGNGHMLQGTQWNGTGIDLSQRTNVTIKSTEIRTFANGIWADYSSNNSITENNIANNGRGIWLSHSSNSSISGNNITDNAYGILLGSSSNYSSVMGNNIVENGWGILFSSSSNNGISGNNITNNFDGVWLVGSSTNSITGNNITANNPHYGIYLYYSSSNKVYHNNFINNPSQVFSNQSINVWDDGYPSGGNYWSDYAARYPNATEIDDSGVWNTPYVIDVNNLDSYPLMNPWAPSGFNGTVYIRADGSIDPPEAPIATSDNVTYILTGKISSEENGIVVERDSILIDGNGYTIGGAGANNAAGIDLSGRENVTIQNTQIQDFYTGVLLNSSSNNHVSGNNITANSNYGIYLVSSPNNSISGNNITNTLDGISLAYSSYNIIAGNNITATDSDGIELAYASNYNFISRNTMTANNWNGIELSDSSNNSIVGNNFDDSSYCVELWSSHNNSIAGNNITNNYCGMILYSGYNDISGNNITNNDCGIFLCYPPSSENRIYHNNFVSNTVQVYSDASVNVFDDSYPSGGNYWSDYDGSDVYCGAFQNVTGSDGIGDAAYTIDASNVDHYPLASQSTMSNFTVILAGIGPVNVGFMSNSTVGNVQIDEAARSLSFNVSGPTGTSGFCRIVLPNIVVESLWGGNYTVLLNGELCSFTSASDSENTYIFISYTHSEHQVVIIPEFPSFLVLALITAAILAAKIYKRRKAAGPDEDVSSLHWLEVEV